MSLFGHPQILNTRIEMGSAAIAGAVILPTLIPDKI